MLPINVINARKNGYIILRLKDVYHAKFQNCNQCEVSGLGIKCKACNTGFEVDCTCGKCVPKCEENFYLINEEKCVSC